MDEIGAIKELTKYLNRCRDAYYNKSSPLISDVEYDLFVDKLEQMEKSANFFLANSPTHTVGYAVNDRLPKVKHKIPLLSLEKTKSCTKASQFTGNYCAILLHKLDGLTIKLEYEGGKLISASTRGNGEVGSLITDNALAFENVPREINYTNRIVLVGEGIIYKDDFERINNNLPDSSKYKTPRNLASGSVQSLDSEVCAKRCVNFLCFNILEGAEEYKLLSEKLNFAHSLGFDTAYWILSPIEKRDEFEETVDSMRRVAERERIPIDGIVIKYDDVEYGRSLGRTGHHYKDGIALKFSEEEEDTILRKVEWQVGRTGKLTPVAVFDPVELDGTTVTKASLHNVNTMMKLNIEEGATVTVVKKNEIIPQIIRSSAKNPYIKYPAFCPICGSVLKEVKIGDSIEICCKNEDCAAKQVAYFVHFCSKECMDIDGLSEKTLQMFVDEKLIHNVVDIYHLHEKKDAIVALDGMGETSFNNLVDAIEKSRIVKLEKFLTSLGIPKLGLAKAKIVSKAFGGSWEEFEKAVNRHYDFSQLETIGDEINNNIHKFMDKRFYELPYYKELVNLMDFQIDEPESATKNMEGKTICITGILNNHTRKELEKMIEDAGGKVTGSVSKKTTYLINNDKTSQSSKNINAQKFGVEIITEDDFVKLL